MNAPFNRRGACPTLSAPMQTGDGLLARLNPVEGVAPSQLAALARAAARHGNGIVEVTARGSLQIRGLTETSSACLAAEVDGLGIAVRAGVPIETGPLAGLDGSEIADPRPLAEAIRRAVEDAGLAARLGPKVSVVVDGGGRFGMGGVLADLRLEAVGHGLWRLAIGGTAGLVGEGDACWAVVRLLTAIAGLGKAGRGRDLASREIFKLFSGLERAAKSHSVAPPSVLPDISPSRGEISQSPKLLISLLVGGAKDHGALPLGPFNLTDGAFALAIALPFGQVSAPAMEAFAAHAAEAGATEMRFSPGRIILVLGLSEDGCVTLRAQAATLGFITDPADPRRAIAACPGAPACASGHIPAREMAAEIARQAEACKTALPAMHISGCAKQCARPADAAFTVIGTQQGCEIHADDGRRGAALSRLPAGQAAAALLHLAAGHRETT